MHYTGKEHVVLVLVLLSTILISPFTESEVRNVVFQMEHTKAPDPHGFSVEFYQVFWRVIKDDLLPLFAELHREALDLYSLNFGMITLIPNVNNAMPICVLNVSFKIFTKVGTNRLNLVAKNNANYLYAGQEHNGRGRNSTRNHP